MTTINTTDDFIRALRENQDFHAAARRELLSEELLELPQRFSRYALETDKKLDALTDAVATLTERVDALAERMDALTERVDALAESVADLVRRADETDRRFERMIERLDRQHEMYRRLHQDFGRFRGSYAADAARKNDRLIAREIARVRGNRVRVTERLDYDSLGRILIDAEQVDTADIHDDTWDTFQNADLVLKVRERNRANTEFYIAVEASYTGNREDFKRAVGHAKMVERVKGVDAYAVVAGARIGRDIEGIIRIRPEGFVREKDTDTALWYQFETTNMEPPDPC